MKRPLKYLLPGFLLLSCLHTTIASGQAPEYQLSGKIAFDGRARKYFYKLVFTDSAGYIGGYSLVGHNAADERKVLIEGHLDTIKGTFEFREVKIVYEPGVFSTDCYVSGWGNFKKERGLAWIWGELRLEPGLCYTKGRFFMNPNDALNYKLTGFNPHPSKLIRQQQLAPSSLEEAPMEEEVLELTTANPLQLEWGGTQLNMMLMDDKEEDGDQLSLILNDEALIREHTLTKKEFVVDASLHTGKNMLVLHAENDGTLPPNTARLILWDETHRYVVHSVINARKDALIELVVPE